MAVIVCKNGEIDSEDATSIPADRSQRKHWIIQDGAVIVDPNAPDPIEEDADAMFQAFIQENPAMKALALVVADLVVATTTLNKQQAVAEVRDRFKQYYKDQAQR